MNGRELAVGTHLAYQVRGVTVNRNRHELRCKKKELGIFRNILWRNLWAAKSPLRILGDSSPAKQGRGSVQAGARTWMTRFATISRVFAP